MPKIAVKTSSAAAYGTFPQRSDRLGGAATGFGFVYCAIKTLHFYN